MVYLLDIYLLDSWLPSSDSNFPNGTLNTILALTIRLIAGDMPNPTAGFDARPPRFTSRTCGNISYKPV